MDRLRLFAIISLLVTSGCGGAGESLVPAPEAPLQRWLAVQRDALQEQAGVTLQVDLQAGLARLFFNGVLTQEVPIESGVSESAPD